MISTSYLLACKSPSADPEHTLKILLDFGDDGAMAEMYRAAVLLQQRSCPHRIQTTEDVLVEGVLKRDVSINQLTQKSFTNRQDFFFQISGCIVHDKSSLSCSQYHK
jgi:hypothetical protein